MSEYFDLAKTPVSRGVTLIEASAGTGKTYTIAGIFLRLIVEEALPVEKILVVTFTEAATAELRERIRKMLSDALSDFQRGESKEPHVQTLIECSAGKTEQSRQQIARALRDFDQAAIFTIHGFCQRALRDNAFESRLLFDTELITDQRQLLQEVLQDFWRRNFYEAEPALVNLVLRAKPSPSAFGALTRTWLNHDQPEILARASAQNRSVAEKAVLKCFKQLQHTWCVEKQEIIRLLTGDTNWANKPYNNLEFLREKIADLQGCLEDGETAADAFECFEVFCASAMLEKLKKKKGAIAPVHEFFRICDEFRQAGKDYVCALELECLEFARQELASRKQAQNVQFFQDLLCRLRDGLQSEGGERLAGALREKYKAALIDEFQDTDPVQFHIFRKVFSCDSHFLFLIGDPKQAIFGFRGADIFTYLAAKRETARQYSLPRNFRSETALVQAVNSIFGFGKAPFIFTDIQFDPAIASGRGDETPLTFSGERKPPMQIWLWKKAKLNPTREEAEDKLPRVVAAEISNLLQSDARLGDRTLKPADIAVLVMENQQARRLQEALSELNIPSVLHTNETLFGTPEAVDCYRLLCAIAEPANSKLVKAALASDIFGLNAAELEKMSQDEDAWQRWLLKFRDWLELWRGKGFIQMFRTLLPEEKVRERLLTLPNGDRRLTNVLHLSEMLHQASTEKKLGPQMLLNWFAEQMNAEGEPAEENQLRLERDEEAVQLVTVHKSKGLEYPIVFCPFSWKPARSPKTDSAAWFHKNDSALTLDLCSPELEKHQSQQVAEDLAEKLRLFYVALTRAKNRCYFVWGPFNGAELSAPAYLLHQGTMAGDDLIQSTAARFPTLGDELIVSDLQRVVALSENKNGPSGIELVEIPETEGKRYSPDERVEKYEVREFTASIETNWKVTSYSALKHGAFEELPDRDAFTAFSEAEMEASGILAFERSLRAGVCLHKLFESLDFASESPDHIGETVRQSLLEHGFDLEHEEPLCQTVKKMLLLPLENNLTLGSVGLSQRLSELEFCFPLKEITPASLQKIFSKRKIAVSGVARSIGKLTFSPVQGILKGFIDLIFRSGEKFYIVDWKTNWLGNTAADYSAENLGREMIRQNYYLQYHLYTLALHKFLQRRLPGYDYEQHFGGVFYVFVRGINPEQPEFGIVRDRPSAELIADLDAELIAK